MSDELRVWVGCLGCYNGGRLVGEWFDAATTPTDEPEWREAMPSGDTTDERWMREHVADGHEELWVFDHEGFGELLTGECSPMEAQRIAEVVGRLEPWQPVEAFAAYVSNHGASIDDSAIDDFAEAFCGEWDDEEDYAQNLAEELGAVPTDFSWPASYIDWERAARDLFMDYFSAPAPGGLIYVFRSL